MLGQGERAELATAVRAACARLASEERVRVVAYERDGKDRGFDAELWAILCDQVGVGAIAVPESFGGAGYGASALAVVAHELGRVLAPVPFLATAVLASRLLVELGASPDRIAALANAERTAAALITGDGGLWDASPVTLTAARRGSGWRIDGSVVHVLHGTAADDLVVLATVDDELGAFLLESAQQGVIVRAERVLDGTRPLASIEFRDAHGERLKPSGAVADVIERCVQWTLAVLSSEQVGACERVLEIATDYARTRVQFGRPIGSFQAIKHRCADMLVELEYARSASLAALDSVDNRDGESRWRTSMAKAVCTEALRNAAHANLQIHGGIGFTWEHSAGLYLKRARTDEVLFGRPGQHWDRLAAEAKLFDR